MGCISLSKSTCYNICRNNVFVVMCRTLVWKMKTPFHFYFESWYRFWLFLRWQNLIIIIIVLLTWDRKEGFRPQWCIHSLPPSKHIKTNSTLPSLNFLQKNKKQKQKTIERNEKEKHLKFEIVPRWVFVWVNELSALSTELFSKNLIRGHKYFLSR